MNRRANHYLLDPPAQSNGHRVDAKFDAQSQLLNAKLDLLQPARSSPIERLIHTSREHPLLVAGVVALGAAILIHSPRARVAVGQMAIYAARKLLHF